MPKAQRKIEALRRGRNAAIAAAAEAQENNVVPTINGCPVLDPIDCQCPKVDINPGEGVKMTCTSEPCPFAHIPLHPQCYQMLEDNLVKRLGTLGSARGWTVPQRRNNLWERKGQSLIGRFCRCRCGHGQMTRDKQALYEKEKAVEKEKKKKAKKAKQLPQLQFNSKPTAVLEEKREGKKRDSEIFSPTSISHQNTFSTTSRSRLYTDRSTSSIQTIALFDTMSELSIVGESSGRYNRLESDMDVVDDEVTETVVPLIVPAPPPPSHTKSYAATIKHDTEISTPKCEDVNKKVQTPDSGLAQSTPRLSSSEVSSQDDQGLGDFRLEIKNNDDSLNPLGLSILSPLEVSSSDEEYHETSRFPALTETPQIPKKKTSIYDKINEIRAQKSISIPKLPLAVSIPDTSTDNGSRYGIQFNTPVREMMETWTSASQVEPTNRSSKAVEVKYATSENAGWTPFFGRGFNLGERLLYFP